MTDDFAHGIDNDTFIRNAFRVLLQRDPSTSEFEDLRWGLYRGATRASVIASLTGSQEFSDKLARLVPEPKPLPSLFRAHPGRYRRVGQHRVFDIERPDDYDFLERRIIADGYYERHGRWAFEIGFDHRTLAVMASLLAPAKVLEVGCGVGGVLSSLLHLGIDCTGLDVSEFSKRRAVEGIADRIVIGDLLTTDLTAERPDLICGFDIFEHFNPNKMDQYLARCAALLRAGGILLINVPAFGEDDVFGTVFDDVLPDWSDEGDLFTSLPCDEDGWPQLGHLVWARPRWWETAMQRHGLVRLRDCERALHLKFDPLIYYARRSFFLAMKEPSATKVDDLAAHIAGSDISQESIERRF